MKEILLLIVLTIVSTAWSQNLREEIVEMNEYLGALDSYQMSVEYLAAEGTELEEKGKVSVMVSELGLFYDLGVGSKMIVNEDKIILVDDAERSIMYAENKRVRRRKSVNMLDQVIQGMDTLIVKADTMLFTEHGGTREYSLRFDNAYFDLVQLRFEGSLLKEVQYFYNSDHVDAVGIENICLVSYKENPVWDELFFNTDFYLQELNGTLVPSEKFNNYLIIYNGSLENYLD